MKIQEEDKVGWVAWPWLRPPHTPHQCTPPPPPSGHHPGAGRGVGGSHCPLKSALPSGQHPIGNDSTPRGRRRGTVSPESRPARHTLPSCGCPEPWQDGPPCRAPRSRALPHSPLGSSNLQLRVGGSCSGLPAPSKDPPSLRTRALEGDLGGRPWPRQDLRQHIVPRGQVQAASPPWCGHLSWGRAVSTGARDRGGPSPSQAGASQPRAPTGVGSGVLGSVMAPGRQNGLVPSFASAQSPAT